MSPFLQLVFGLSVILISAKLGGYITTRFGQPSVLGELLVGLILGPSLVNLINLPFITDTHLEETVKHLGEIGVLLLMFLAGLELHISDLRRNTRVSAYAGTLGVLIPVVLGLVIGELNGMDFNHAAFLGLTLGATSVSISAQTLMEMGVLRSRVGLGLLGAAVFDDVLVILLLSTFLALQGGSAGGGVAQVLLVMLRMAAFLVLSVAFGVWGLPRLVKAFSRLSISQGGLTLAIVIMLVYGLAAELVGNMAAITGTFIAGLFFGRLDEKEDFEHGIHALAYSFFVPIFFVSIGLSVNIREISLSVFGLMLVIIIVAIMGKIVGAGLGARLAKFSWLESLQLGTGMVSRGEVGLIVAQVGMTQNLLDQTVFSAIVGMVLATTLITPPMLRALFTRKKTATVR
jgi:Kef-type K+ transport system membrane component KefB